MQKRRLLWIGDAVASTGFARSTHHILDVLKDQYEIHVLGINYNGDPHEYPYKIYPCTPGGDAFGVGRVAAFLEELGPAVIVVQTDPWYVQDYLKRVGNAPVIGIIAVDGKNCAGTELNGLATAVFWTHFGEAEAKAGGYTGPSAVIPLGVDLDIYRPMDKRAMRERFNLPNIFRDRGLPEDTFIVGVMGRNQWRKRLDLTVEYFAHWVHTYNVTDACLWLHVAPTGDDAFNLNNLAKYHRVADRVFIPVIPRWKGVDEQVLARIHNLFDVLFSTTLGEGFGLPMFEAMASSVPLVVPNWSALGELVEDGGVLVPCSSIAVHPNQVEVVGGVMDKEKAAASLDFLYRTPEARLEMGRRAMTVASQEKYRWHNIGLRFQQVVNEVLSPTEVAVGL